MKQRLIWLWFAAFVFMLLYHVWYRRPAGRSSSEPEIPDIKDMTHFDDANPNADSDVRNTIFEGIQAHLEGDLDNASNKYNQVLQVLPDEPIAKHNLNLLEWLRSIIK